MYVCPNSTVRHPQLNAALGSFFVRVYSLLGFQSINQSVFNRVPNVPFQSYYVPKVVKERVQFSVKILEGKDKLEKLQCRKFFRPFFYP